jgi:cephalosporin hydroxylase|tara:strand:+ start:394 stop:987 length:594 start_codon:yes stop_codon:yes gene_type:complete
MSELFEKEFVNAYTNPSDMYEHVKYLKSLCDDEDVNHVTEMGTRTGVSTRAWLNSDVTLRACDLKFDPSIKKLMDIAAEEGKDVSYYEGNCLEVEIEETDLLFLDTWHVYDQVVAELNLHASKVKKYIAFHDTITFGFVDEQNKVRFGIPEVDDKLKDGTKNVGIFNAIIQFMIENPEWRFKEHRTNNNGLTVIERI